MKNKNVLTVFDYGVREIKSIRLPIRQTVYIYRFRQTFTQGVDGLRADIEKLKAALRNVNSPVVFSHNDLLLTNIILQRDASAGGRPVNVAFIDYEYAMPNNQAYDIANHFTEFAGV